MDRNTKIAFAVAGWCIMNLAVSSVQHKRDIAKLTRVQRKLVDAHNKRVTDEKFTNIVKNYDTY